MSQEKTQQTLELTAQHQGKRLDVALEVEFADLSRAQVKKLITQGAVRSSSGKRLKPSTPVEAGMSVWVDMAACQPQGLDLEPIPMSLDILFEDEDLWVINKPAGLSVHPGAGGFQPTLVHGLLHLHTELAHSYTQAEHVETGEPAEAEGYGQARFALNPQRPGIVHRLDKDTTGLIVCAKHAAAHRGLAKQFAEKTNLREYIALLNGVLPDDQLDVTSYLRRDPEHRLKMSSLHPDEVHEKESARLGSGDIAEGPGKFARSVFKRNQVYAGRLSLVMVQLKTGRTHQIRVHASDLGMPVVGDLLYGGQITLPLVFSDKVRNLVGRQSRQLLHAHRLGFCHPTSGEQLEFEAPVPADFQTVLNALEAYRYDEEATSNDE